MKKVAVVAGGLSSEREVSLMTGQGVLESLLKQGYDAFLLELTADIFDFVRTLEKEKPDVIFNALHGRYGEDGNIQGLFNLMQIPYTHSGVLASAMAMDKKMAKLLFEKEGLPVAKDKIVTLFDLKEGNHLPYPYVIKPINEGSSVGVYIITSAEDEEALINRWPFGGAAVMMEEYIRGREMSVPVMGGKALGIVEVAPKKGFYTYENKYQEGRTDHLIPAPIPQKQTELLMDYAVRAHKALGCKGVSRTDFRYDDTNPDQEPLLVALEINNQPGMTPLSLLPEVAKKAGISYDEVVLSLIEEAECEK